MFFQQITEEIILRGKNPNRATHHNDRRIRPGKSSKLTLF